MNRLTIREGPEPCLRRFCEIHLPFWIGVSWGNGRCRDLWLWALYLRILFGECTVWLRFCCRRWRFMGSSSSGWVFLRWDWNDWRLPWSPNIEVQSGPIDHWVYYWWRRRWGIPRCWWVGFRYSFAGVLWWCWSWRFWRVPWPFLLDYN